MKTFLYLNGLNFQVQIKAINCIYIVHSPQRGICFACVVLIYANEDEHTTHIADLDKAEFLNHFNPRLMIFLSVSVFHNYAACTRVLK